MPKSDEVQTPNRQEPETSPSTPAEPRAPLSFDDLSGGKREVQIEHRGQVYRLRTTRNGGLILNK